MWPRRALFVGVVALLGAATASPAVSEVRHDVRVIDDAYDDGDGDPSVTEITAGDRVAWHWSTENDHPHTVTALDGGFDSDRPCGDEVAACRSPGYVFTHTFPEAGTYRYRCEVHLTMIGTVEVVPPSGGGEEASPDPSDEPSRTESASPSASPAPSERDASPDGRDGDPSSRSEPAGEPSPSAGATPASGTTRRDAPAREFPGLALASPAPADDRRPGRPVLVAPDAEPSMTFEPFPEAPASDVQSETEPSVEIPAPRRGLGRGALTGIATVGVLASAAAVGSVILRS